MASSPPSPPDYVVNLSSDLELQKDVPSSPQKPPLIVTKNIVTDFNFEELQFTGDDAVPASELFKVSNRFIQCWSFSLHLIIDYVKSYLSKNGQTWASKDILVSALRVYTNRVGFLITLRSTGTIQCNRRNYCNYHKERTNSRSFKAGKLQCNCDFHIKVKAGKSVVDAKGRKRPAWTDPYCTATIVGLNLEHSGGCVPCPQQHVMTKSRAGKYVGDISTMALFTLCNTASRAGRDLDSIVSAN